MIKSLRDAQITDGLPRIVREQPWVKALSMAAAALHKKTMDYIDGSQIYTAIDSVAEPVLDALAVNWKIDWYDTGYDIDRKRRIVKTALTIRRTMGTVGAVRAQADANLRHRERILPTEKAAALKQQVEAIKHQGARPGEDDRDAGKRSTQIVGDRNGMNYKQVQRYIRLTELVPDLQKMVDEKQLSFTPAVEISFIRPKHQKYIAVAIEGQASSPSLSQAQKMRELDKEGKLNGDVIDGILSEQKKEVDKVIINSAELEKYFGKDKTPREMKDTILALLDEWKEKQPPELGKPDKKKDMEK